MNAHTVQKNAEAAKAARLAWTHLLVVASVVNTPKAWIVVDEVDRLAESLEEIAIDSVSAAVRSMMQR